MSRTLKTLRAVLLVAAAQTALSYAPVGAAAGIALSIPTCDSFTLTGTAPNQVLTCVTGTPPPPPTPGSTAAPSGCTLTPSQTPVTAGASLTLTASCSGGGAPTSWSWTGAGASQSTLGPSQFLFASETSTYTVTPSNSGGSGNTASTTVTVSTSGGTPPPGTGGGASIQQACAGLSYKVIDAAVPVGGGANNVYRTTSSGVFSNGSSGFGANDIVVVRFTAPAGDGYFNIGMNEMGGTLGVAAYRTVSISKDACDFALPRSASSLWTSDDVMSFSLNLSTTGSQRTNLEPGLTYYLNIKNYQSGAPTCSSSQCNVFFTFANPG